MEYDTAGSPIFRPSFFCTCGSTVGCEKCNPDMFKKKLVITEKFDIPKKTEEDFYRKVFAFWDNPIDDCWNNL